MFSTFAGALATLLGAIITLVAALVVQVRGAAATRAQARANLQRDALAELIAGAELLADDIREMRRAHLDKDFARRNAVWPRYLSHWSDFVGAIARVRLHGPEEVRDEAWAFHNSRTAYLGDLADSLMRGKTVRAADWNAAAKSAAEEREKFAKLAITVTESPGRRFLGRRLPRRMDPKTLGDHHKHTDDTGPLFKVKDPKHR